MKKGFASFILMISVLMLLLNVNNLLQKNSFEIIENKNELIKAEIAQKERTLLENNTDTIVEAKLAEEILKRNFNSNKIQNSINNALLNYLNNRAQACEIITKKRNKLDLIFLNRNTNAFALEVDGVIYAEYSYVSNIQKSEIVCKILQGNILLEYKIPTGYTIRAAG